MFDIGFPPTWSTLKKLIWLKVAALAQAIYETVTGAIATFTTLRAAPLKSLVVDIEPVQNLNGYDNPWPAGGGKNKFQNTATSRENNGVTFTVNSDGTVSCSGNATATAVLTMDWKGIDGTEYILNGAPSGASGNTYKLDYNNNGTYVTDYGYGATFTASVGSGTQSVRIVIYAGHGNGLVFKPMIRLSSVSDATFAPYSNICPITGHTQAKATRTGKNLIRLVESEMTVSGWNARFPFFIKEGSYVISCQNQIHASDNTKFGLRLTFYDSSMNVVKDIWDNYAFGQGTFSGSLVFSKTEAERISIIELRPRSVGITYQNIADGQIMLEIGSTASDYESYTGEIVTVDLGGTRYGCTLYPLLGQMVVDRRYTTIGEENVSAVSGTQYSNFQVTPGSGVKVKNATSETLCISSAFKGYSFNAAPAVEDNYAFASGGNLRIKNTANVGLTGSEWKELMKDVQLCYYLANPTTVQLTPTEMNSLLGVNNIWADTGNVTVEYRSN